MRPRLRPIVAIDGPAGAGKSTVARRVAERLGFVRVDTGALYRSVALAARDRGIAWDDEPRLGALTAALDIRFVVQEGKGTRVLVDGVDVSEAIRTPEISRGASDVSRLPSVRAALLDLQRRLGESGGVVLEGRDIGTVIFPDAEVKIFLTAAAQVRARRRCDELRARGIPADLDVTLREIEARDRQDSTRNVAPLKPAPGAIVVDTSELPLEAVVDQVVGIVCKDRGG